MYYKRIALFLGSIVFIGAIVYILFDTTKFSSLHEDFGTPIPVKYPIMGMDVSHHQGNIDFNAASHMEKGGDSIAFVYIKATEGEDFVDSKYDANAEGFAKFKMNYGFYHFFQPESSALKQAHFYSDIVKGYNFKLIPVLDVEKKGDRTKKQLVDSINVFLKEVEKLLDTRPMVYTYLSFYNDYLKGSSIQNELLWMAAYSYDDSFMENDNVIIWQFSEVGTVNGISTHVDLNVAKEVFNQKVLRIR